jgi:hypothetical protein
MARATCLLVACALALGGCGGEDGGDRLSKAELVSRADSICKTYEARLDALGTPENQEQLADFADKALPIARQGRDDLADLEPPEELEDEYDAWLEQGDRAIDIVERLRDAAKDGDSAEVQKIAGEAEATDREANRLARQLGFRQCGDTGTASSP